jgi:succinate dehydrogenase / fumarate reductase flavoprotein subunit
LHILIIGCGLAGLSAAITAAKAGCTASVLAPLPPERSESVLAAGGINAALNTKGQDDSWQQHFRDTMKAGADLADEAAVRNLTEHAPALIRELAAAGIVFSRDKEGNPDLRYFGGQRKMRTVYAKAGIGKQLVSGLTAIARRYEAEGKIQLLLHRKFLRFIPAGERFAGAVVENTVSGTLEYLSADALIVGSGGMSGLFPKTTGSCVSSGSVSASLFASGIEMGNLEMIQYHPTTFETPQKRMLISEAARGEGGRLFTIRNGQRWYFMEEWYGKNGNLMPRDIVSQSIYKVCHDMKLGLDGKNQVGLDLSFLSDDIVHGKLKEIADITQTYLGLDPKKEVIPVYPGVHYFMGGILTDRNHRTSIPGIYAAGGCACIYHGANRLGGNSTLGAVFGGRTAAETAFADGQCHHLSENAGHAAEESARALMRDLQGKAGTGKERPGQILSDIQNAVSQHLGIVRSADGLETGETLLAQIGDRKPYFSAGHIADALAVQDLRLLGSAMLSSALFRRESRGSHARTDFPQRDDVNFKATCAAKFQNGRVCIQKEEIGRTFDAG